MPVRIAIIRSTGQGEQFQADVCQWNPVTGDMMHASVADMHELVDDVFSISDVRLMEMNTRMLEAYNFEKYFTPEVWSRVVSILDVLAGRTTPDAVVRLWEASVEETKDLERIRIRHAEQQRMVEVGCECVNYRGVDADGKQKHVSGCVLSGLCCCSVEERNIYCDVHGDK